MIRTIVGAILAIVIGQGLALLVGLYLLSVADPITAIVFAVVVGRLCVRFEKYFGV